MLLTVKLRAGEAAVLAALQREDRIVVELEITRDMLVVVFSDDPAKK